MFKTPPQTSSFSNKKQCTRAPICHSADSKEDKKNRSILREIESLDQMTKSLDRDKRMIRSDTIVTADHDESDVSSICSEEDNEDDFFLCTPISKMPLGGSPRKESSLNPRAMELASTFSLTPRKTHDTSTHTLIESIISSGHSPLPTMSPARGNCNSRKRRHISIPSFDAYS